MVSYPPFCKRKDRQQKFTVHRFYWWITVKTLNCYFHRPPSDSTKKNILLMNHEQNLCNYFLGMKIKFIIKIQKLYKYLKKMHAY